MDLRLNLGRLLILLGRLFIAAGCQSYSKSDFSRFDREAETRQLSNPVFLPNPVEELRMGHTVDAFVQQKFVLLDDPNLSTKIEEIGKRLLASTHPRLQTYQFRAINHNDINALSAPGGYVYLTYGILRLAQKESEVAAILAHEIAHVEKIHHMKQYRTAQSIQLLLNASAIGLGLAGAGDAQKIVQQAGPLSALIALNTFSRYEENQADDYALYLLDRAGYPMDSLVTMLKRMLAEKERTQPDQNLPTIFLTHPPTSARIYRLQHEIQQLNRQENEAFHHVEHGVISNEN